MVQVEPAGPGGEVPKAVGKALHASWLYLFA